MHESSSDVWLSKRDGLWHGVFTQLRLLSWLFLFKKFPPSLKVAWPSGLRRWFKAPVSSEAWVRIPPLPKTLLCIPLFPILSGRDGSMV